MINPLSRVHIAPWHEKESSWFLAIRPLAWKRRREELQLHARWSPSTVRRRREGRNGTEWAVAIAAQQDEPTGIAYDVEQYAASKGTMRSLRQQDMMTIYIGSCWLSCQTMCTTMNRGTSKGLEKLGIHFNFNFNFCCGKKRALAAIAVGSLVMKNLIQVPCWSLTTTESAFH